MTLIVEDGTGLANAESYISVTDADVYHGNRGNQTWIDLPFTTKEQLLRKATDYLTNAYREKWSGDRLISTQALDFPRTNEQSVPNEVKAACAIMALKAKDGELLADTGTRVLSEKIGAIETKYSQSSPQNTQYRAVDSMLKMFFIAGFSGVSSRVDRG